MLFGLLDQNYKEKVSVNFLLRFSAQSMIKGNT
jgi:hypothetical protein